MTNVTGGRTASSTTNDRHPGSAAGRETRPRLAQCLDCVGPGDEGK
jgi:hypothetical protein